VRDRIIRGAFAALLLIGFAACSENVTGSLGCPTLCVDESATLRDTVLAGVVTIDSTFLGFPRPGENRDITLLNQVDTADVRIGIHYDTLPTRYQIPLASSDSAIRSVDSATMIFLIDTLVTKPTTPLIIDAFDIDTTASDTTTATLAALYRPDRLIGSQSYAASDITSDTLRLAISNDVLFGKIRDSLRLRVGLKVRGIGSTKLRVLGSTFPPRIRFRASPDTTVVPDTLFPQSITPAGDIYGQTIFRLFPVYVTGRQPAPPVGQFVIGGLSGARTYLQFDIPSILLDSVTVIRASLQLTQVPARGISATADSVSVYAQPVLAAPSITDIGTAATFLGAPGLYGIDSVRFGARQSGSRSVELVNLLRFWRAVGGANTSRSLVLRSPQEGNAPGELDFISTEGVLASRPTLRITYVPRRGFGIP
jgi:hypothetical protein